MSRFALLWLALAALVAAPGVVRSGADFTAGSPSPGNGFAAAADFNTVAVSMTNPGSPLRGSVALASAPTSERGIERVRYESSPAGAGTWTTACEATSAPFTCSWDTTAISGSRDLRAVAIDRAGYSRTSAVLAARMVDNTLPAVALATPDAWLEGTETLGATASDAESGLASLAIEYRPAGGAWVRLCTGATSPRSCALNTTTLADGAYELRARATDGAGNERIGAPVSRAVDNVAPTISIVPPTTALRGTVSFPLDAADAGTGISSVTLEFRPQIAGQAWQTVCVDYQASYACSNLDTNEVPDGLYEARAIARDGANRSTTTAVVSNVRVDNTAPSAALADPGSPLQGSVAFTGTASDAGSGVVSWTLQQRPAGGTTWTGACVDAATPWGCTWATGGVADGLYDLRAVARDAAGNETGSTVVANRRLDNVAPAGSDIQATNGGATAGRLETGDSVRLTWTEPIAPASVLGGWTGTSQAIVVRVTNSANDDRMDFRNAASTARLNLVNSATDLRLGGNFAGSTVDFNATMVQSGSSITVTLGTYVSGTRATAAAAAAMTWRPSAAATDLAGRASGTTTVTESGSPADLDF